MIQNKQNKQITSSAFLVGRDKTEIDRLQDQYVRARPFLKQLTILLEREMDRTVREEERNIVDSHELMKAIGRRAGMRYVVDLIKK